MTAILQAETLSVSYDGVNALVDVDLELARGQIVGLIGPNGAGKTTFVDAVTGFASATGRVLLDGRDLSGLSPEERARAGLARTWQSLELFDELTVRENLNMSAGRPGLWQTAREIVTGHPIENEAVAQTLDLLGLDELADAKPEDLSQGHRKLVDVARALAAAPRVICLDEPAAGLDTNETVQLGKLLRRLVEQDTAMLLVDHDMGLVLSVCDVVVVLDFGRVIARGKPADVRGDPQVVRAYLGSAAEELAAETK